MEHRPQIILRIAGAFLHQLPHSPAEVGGWVEGERREIVHPLHVQSFHMDGSEGLQWPERTFRKSKTGAGRWELRPACTGVARARSTSGVSRHLRRHLRASRAGWKSHGHPCKTLNLQGQVGEEPTFIHSHTAGELLECFHSKF